MATPWFADIANYLVQGVIPDDFNYNQRKRFLSQVKAFFWDDPYLFKVCGDGVIRRCVLETEIPSILHHCHSLACGGHYGVHRTAAKVLEAGFYWRTLNKDCQEFVSL